MTNETRVPTPSESEQRRQKMVHSLRMERVQCVKRLAQSSYTDVGALTYLAAINAQIDILRLTREPYPQGLDEPEPSLAEIESRGLDWYWEEWRTDDTDEEDDDDSDA